MVEGLLLREEGRLWERLGITGDVLVLFCRRWRVAELGLFGSVLRDDFDVESDVLVLVRFQENHGWHLLDFLTMQEELEELLKCRVDLLQYKELRNPYRCREILRTVEVVYVGE